MAKDEVDIASEQETYAREEAIWQAQRPQRLQRRGTCYNCAEPAVGLFCDTDCRADYEREQAVYRRQYSEGS